MKRLRKKLNSQSGASILLALLLFFVCCMVAASVLAASASNAGKAKSNRVEQQKYLTLSSAIQLVCDEIGLDVAGDPKAAYYTWQYTVYEWDVTTTTTTTTTEADGSTTTATDVKNQHYFQCRQDDCELAAETEKHYACGDLTDLLPLRASLNGELKKQFEAKGGALEGYISLSDAGDAVVEDVTVCTLRVTLPDDLDGYPYLNPADPAIKRTYEAEREVTVRVELNHATHHITLTAWQGAYDTSPLDPSSGTDRDPTVMIAELMAEEGTAPLLTYNNPEGRQAGTLPVPAAGSTTSGDTTVAVSVFEKTPDVSTKTMTWTLNWIKKGAS